MKKLFLFLLLIPLFGISQNTLTGAFVTADTITSDTLYRLNTTDVYFWSLQIKTAGVTSNDTVWAKVQVSDDNGTTWFDYANMDSIEITSTYPNRKFRDMAGNEGTRLGLYINVGVLDTIVVSSARYVLRPKNR